MNTSIWSPTPSDFLQALEGQNPWHDLGTVPVALAREVRRPLADLLWRVLLPTVASGEPTSAVGATAPGVPAPTRHQLILGPRRVGKTVAMYQTIQRLIEAGVDRSRLWFLRLDHPLLMREDLGTWVRALIDRSGASVDRPTFLFLDEINYATDWDRWLKTFFDEQWPVRIVASSSSTAILRTRGVESGIGRWSEQYLAPYSFTEFLSLRKVPTPPLELRPTLFETLVTLSGRPTSAPFGGEDVRHLLWTFLLVGGFPELLDALRDDDLEGGLLRSQQVLRSEAVQRVAGMDLPQAFDIRNPILLERLLYLLAGQITGVVNMSKLATDLEVSRQTVHQYVEYLARAFLIHTLPNYSRSEETVQRRGRKVYFVDGAVRNAALQRGLAPLRDPQERGVLIENAAAAHLAALAMQSGSRLYHWRVGTDEVDFIHEESGEPLAIEIGSGGRHHERGMQALMTRHPVFRGRCFLVSSDSSVRITPSQSPTGVGRIPFEEFLLAVGAKTQEALERRMW